MTYNVLNGTLNPRHSLVVITKPETGSRLMTLWLASWMIDMTS